MKPAINTSNNRRATAYFWLFTIPISLLSFLTFYDPKNPDLICFSRTWGFDHVSYFSVPVVAAYYVLCLLLIIPASNRVLHSGLLSVSEKLRSIFRNKKVLFILVALASVFIFRLLKVKYFLLGDYNLRIAQTMKQDFLATEYFTMGLLYLFSTFLEQWKITSQEAFELYSYIAGGAFVYVSLLIADLTGRTGIEKTVLFIAQVCGAIVMVFAGYIEIYATPVLALSIYIYAGLAYLKNRTGFWMPVTALAIAHSMHLISIVAIPSLLVLFYHRNKTKFPFIAKLSATVTILIVTLIVLAGLVVIFNLKSSYVLPITSPASNSAIMGFFSLTHLWEFLNGQFLATGFSILLIAMLFIKMLREKTGAEVHLLFLASLAGGLLLFIGCADLHRGSADWDIMAFSSVPVNLVAVIMVFTAYNANTSLRNYLATAVTGLVGLNTLLWLIVNHTDISLKKVTDMLRNDPAVYYKSRITGLYQMVILLDLNKLHVRANELSLKICNSDSPDNVRSCVVYAKRLHHNNKRPEARKFFLEIMERFPDTPEPYFYLTEFHSKKGNYDTVRYYINRLFDRVNVNPGPFMFNIHVKRESYIEFFNWLSTEEQRSGNISRADTIRKIIAKIEVLNNRELRKKKN